MTAPANHPLAPKRIGRPPLPLDQRAEPTRPRSVRLTDAEWSELQRRGTPALREWLRS